MSGPAPDVFQSPIALADNQVYKSKSQLIVHERKVKRYSYNQDKLQWDVSNSKPVFLETNMSAYMLEQFHLHQKGEHTLFKKSYPIEVHFVYVNRQGSILALGFLARKSQHHTSSFFQHLLANKPVEIPRLEEYFSYSGSLTTPPFNKNVQWGVSAKVLKITQKDLQRLVSQSKGSRKLQERQGRGVISVTKS